MLLSSIGKARFVVHFLRGQIGTERIQPERLLSVLLRESGSLFQNGFPEPFPPERRADCEEMKSRHRIVRKILRP